MWWWWCGSCCYTFRDAFSRISYLAEIKKIEEKQMSEINIAKGKNVDRDRSRVFGYGCDWVQGQVCVAVDRCWWTWVECQYCVHLLASPRHTYIHTWNSAAISIAICPFLCFCFRYFSSTKFTFTVTSTTTFFTVLFGFSSIFYTFPQTAQKMADTPLNPRQLTLFDTRYVHILVPMSIILS